MDPLYAYVIHWLDLSTRQATKSVYIIDKNVLQDRVFSEINEITGLDDVIHFWGEYDSFWLSLVCREELKDYILIGIEELPGVTIA